MADSTITYKNQKTWEEQPNPLAADIESSTSAHDITFSHAVKKTPRKASVTSLLCKGNAYLWALSCSFGITLVALVIVTCAATGYGFNSVSPRVQITMVRLDKATASERVAGDLDVTVGVRLSFSNANTFPVTIQPFTAQVFTNSTKISQLSSIDMPKPVDLAAKQDGATVELPLVISGIKSIDGGNAMLNQVFSGKPSYGFVTGLVTGTVMVFGHVPTSKTMRVDCPFIILWDPAHNALSDCYARPA